MKVVVLGDIHAPFHDEDALNLTKFIIKDTAPDVVVSVGDFLDFYSISRYPKNRARKLDAAWEMDTALDLAAELRQLCPDAEYVITFGNHEDRLRKFLDENKHLENIKDFDLEGRFRECGWKVVPYGESHRIGHMLFSHDFGRAGKQALLQATNDVGSSVTFGHTHFAGIWYQPTIHGDCHVAFNVGWLGDKTQLDYGHRDKAKRDSMTGIGMVTFDVEGCFVVHFHPFINTGIGYKTYVEGYWYEWTNE